MNTTWATEQISDSLSAGDEAYTREYWLLGISEENGVGLSKGIRQTNGLAHVYVNGKKKYTRIFIREC